MEGLGPVVKPVARSQEPVTGVPSTLSPAGAWASSLTAPLPARTPLSTPCLLLTSPSQGHPAARGMLLATSGLGGSGGEEQGGGWDALNLGGLFPLRLHLQNKTQA